MRKRAFNQRGSILRWFAPKRSYTEGPLVQDAAPGSEACLENRQQSVRVAAVEDTVKQQTSLENEDGGIEHRKSPVRRPLPLSPLMDPAYLAAKQKYNLPKAAPSKELTPFQQQLAKNPYAQALVTPVRMCSATFTQLPSFFLQDFEPIAHPSTNEPWYLPRSLTSAYSSYVVPDESTSSDSPKSFGTRRGPKFYVLSRASLLRAMSMPKSRFTYVDGRFSLMQNKKFKASREMKTRWRSDVDMLTLNLMRRRIVEGLKYLCERNAGYLHGSSDWEYAKGSKQVGAFLWLGPRDGRNVAAIDEVGGPATEQRGNVDVSEVGEVAVDELEDRATSQQEQLAHESSSGVAPGEFATLDLDKEMKTKVPVHNLQLLLGNAMIEDLRRHTPRIFRHEVVVVKHRRTTIDVQLKLWKLQGYVAEHKQVDDK